MPVRLEETEGVEVPCDGQDSVRPGYVSNRGTTKNTLYPSP